MNTQHHTSTARCRWSVYFLSSSLAQCNIYLSCFILKVKYVSRHVTSCPCVFLPPSLSTPDPNYSPDFPLLSLLILVSSLLFRIPVFPVFFGVFLCPLHPDWIFGLRIDLCMIFSKTLPFWTCIPCVFLHLSVFCTQTTKKLDIVTSCLCSVMYFKSKTWK